MPIARRGFIGSTFAALAGACSRVFGGPVEASSDTQADLLARCRAVAWVPIDPPFLGTIHRGIAEYHGILCYPRAPWSRRWSMVFDYSPAGGRSYLLLDGEPVMLQQYPRNSFWPFQVYVSGPEIMRHAPYYPDSCHADFWGDWGWIIVTE